MRNVRRNESADHSTHKNFLLAMAIFENTKAASTRKAAFVSKNEIRLLRHKALTADDAQRGDTVTLRRGEHCCDVFVSD